MLRATSTDHMPSGSELNLVQRWPSLRRRVPTARDIACVTSACLGAPELPCRWRARSLDVTVAAAESADGEWARSRSASSFTASANCSVMGGRSGSSARPRTVSCHCSAAVGIVEELPRRKRRGAIPFTAAIASTSRLSRTLSTSAKVGHCPPECSHRSYTTCRSSSASAVRAAPGGTTTRRRSSRIRPPLLSCCPAPQRSSGTESLDLTASRGRPSFTRRAAGATWHLVLSTSTCDSPTTLSLLLRPRRDAEDGE